MREYDADVLVVGAGPTGLMLAGELRLQGVSTIVVDQLDEPMGESRALGFSARTMEEFEQRGLLSQLGDPDVIPVGHFGGLPLDFRVLEGGSYGARGVPQSATEAVLASRARELGASIRRGHAVTELRTKPDGVELDVTSAEGTRCLRAAYVVGCDGARSTVRRQAGVDFVGNDPTLEMWLADVAGCPLPLRFSGERVPGGMVMVLPLGPDARRVVVFEHDRGPRPTSEPPSFVEVADAFQRLTGERIHDGTPLWVSFFTDRSRQATEYRRERVFVAGDAAHVHLPIGGQGMSAGVQDAVNLGWKLAAEIHGWAPSGLLDTYHSERHPVAARILANTLSQRTLYLSDSELDPLRDVVTELMEHESVRVHLAGMITGLDIRHDVGEGDHPLLGRRLPRREVVVDGQKTTTLALLRSGRGLLLDLADTPAARQAVAGWADRVDQVVVAEQSEPLPTGCLLVRPDGYVAWAADASDPDVDHLVAALRRWFGEPR